jgi:hypothetical protein
VCVADRFELCASLNRYEQFPLLSLNPFVAKIILQNEKKRHNNKNTLMFTGVFWQKSVARFMGNICKLKKITRTCKLHE